MPAPLSLIGTRPTLRLTLRGSGIGTVLWATGHRPHHPWLHVPVLDPIGRVAHHRGRTPSPGLYVVGQRWQTSRSSSFLAGMGRDARAVVADLVHGLAGSTHRSTHGVHPVHPLDRQESIA